MTTDILFHIPIGGVPYQDWTIVNYVDLDLSSGIQDFRGGNYTYNGHDAIDFTLPHFEAMDRGVPVYASVPGTVTRVRDSEPDRCSTENPCNTPANFVEIDHGNGLITQYLHLRTDSASVSVGQFVDAGQQIGEVGSSGNSSDAHLHFAVFKDGRVIEINTPGDEFAWQSPIPYADDVVGSLDHDITDHAPSFPELRERPETVDSFVPQPGITPHLWVHLHGVDQGDDLDFYFRQPDGSEYAHHHSSAPQIRYGWWFAAVELPDDPDVGVWEVEFQHNGSTMLTDTFTITEVPQVSTVYVSTTTNGTVEGISFKNEDILAYDPLTGIWSMHFDGSDVLPGGDINAFHIDEDGSILFSLRMPATLPDVGRVDDSDIIRFIPTATGNNTSGTFELYFDGSDVGLDTDREDLYAIARTPDGRLVISTKSSATLPGLSSPTPRDEDLLVFNHTSLGENTRGTWEFYFDGSDEQLSTSSTEDIYGASIDKNGDIYLTTKGDFAVSGLTGNGADIFTCNDPITGANSSCSSFSQFFDGSANGLAGEVIDGLSLV